MPPDPAAPPPSRKRLPLWFVPLSIAVAIPVLFRAAPHTDLNPRSRLADMVTGTAYRPYVKRVLVPLLVRAADAVTPAPARSALTTLTERSAFLRERLRWQPAHASWHLLVLLIHGASLVAFTLLLGALLGGTYDLKPSTTAFAASIGCLLVPLHFGYQNFLYDLPQLALWSAGLLLIQRRRWTALQVLWPIGMLNKETFILLAGVFWWTQRHAMARRERWLRFGVLLGSAALVWIALAFAFRHNPGETLEWHLARNLGHRPSPRQLFHDLIYWGSWLVAFAWWREKRTLALLAIAVEGALLATGVFLGFLGEYRDYYEAYPLLCLMLFHTAHRLARGRRPAPAGSPLYA